MIEQQLHLEFDKTFHAYALWKPNNRASGWPDRAIQIGSSIVWCELKITHMRKDGRILLSNFEREQAAFMYKWSRNGGSCFILFAVLDKAGQEKLGYGIVRPLFFSDWLMVRQKLYSLIDLDLFADNMKEVLEWFKHTYGKLAI